MGNAKQPLREGEGGPYGELAGRPRPGGLVLLFVPSLAALLTRAEELVGGPLTADQVTRVRNAAQVVVSRPEPAAAVEARRGYADVDPADPWASWQAIRSGAATTTGEQSVSKKRKAATAKTRRTAAAKKPKTPKKPTKKDPNNRASGS